MKKGFAELTKAQMRESIVSTTEKLVVEPIPLSYPKIQNYYLELAMDQVFRKPENFSMEDIVPPSSKSTLEFSQTVGGGRRILKELTEMVRNPKEVDFDCFEEFSNWLMLNPTRKKGQTQSQIMKANSARIALLVEANKVRYLTVQSTFYQTFCRPLQNYMLREWKDCSYSTMNKDWKEDFKSVYEYNKRHNLLHASADYSDATNLLKPEATKRVIFSLLNRLGLSGESYFFKRIVETLQPRHLNLTKMMFVNHPTKEDGQELTRELIDVLEETFGEFALQKSGQLMGNPLSFVILCVINLATMIQAKLEDFLSDHYPKRPSGAQVYEFLKGTLLINGDDLFTGFETEASFNRFIQISGSYGLKVNLKTILGRTHGQMNNVMITDKGEVNYLNLGLYFNNNIKNFKPVELEQISELAQNFEYDLDIEVGFIRDTLSRLNRKIPRRMWTVSKAFGGLGVRDTRVNQGFILSRHTKYRLLKKYTKTYLKQPLTLENSVVSKVLKERDEQDLEVFTDLLDPISKLFLVRLCTQHTELMEDEIATNQDEEFQFDLTEVLVEIGNHLATLTKFIYMNREATKHFVSKLQLSGVEFQLPIQTPTFDDDFQTWEPRYFVRRSGKEYIEKFMQLTPEFHLQHLHGKYRGKILGSPRPLSETLDNEN